MIRICSTLLLVAAAAVSGCAALSPSPTDLQAVRIEGTPGVAVVYLVRTYPDLSDLTAPVVVDDRMIGSTHAGTYYRLELPAGQHVIRGYAADNGAIRLDLQADRLYFVQQTVAGSWRVTNPQSFFRVIDESRGRAAMIRAQRAG